MRTYAKQALAVAIPSTISIEQVLNGGSVLLAFGSAVLAFIAGYFAYRAQRLKVQTAELEKERAELELAAALNRDPGPDASEKL